MEALKMRLDPDKMEVAVLCFMGWADARRGPGPSASWGRNSRVEGEEMNGM